MAEIAKPTIIPTIGSLLLGHNCRISGLYAGEDLGAFDAVYVKSDGKVWRANGTAANAAARVRGWSATKCRVAQNDPVYKENLARQGASAGDHGPAPFAQLITTDAAKWRAIVTAAGIKLD